MGASYGDAVWRTFCSNPITDDSGPSDRKLMNRKKILVVDDNEVILKTLSFKLKANNYDVVTALDGSEAVAAVRKEKPDAILLDISFPPDVAHGGGVPWDGFRIIQWLRRMDEAKDIPIIIITGGDAAKYQSRAVAEGALAFFTKPIDHEALLKTLHGALAGKDESKAPTA
jgi:CheY-like chemotaxis protein